MKQIKDMSIGELAAFIWAILNAEALMLSYRGEVVSQFTLK
jgi:hypothetical protein